MFVKFVTSQVRSVEDVNALLPEFLLGEYDLDGLSVIKFTNGWDLQNIYRMIKIKASGMAGASSIPTLSYYDGGVAQGATGNVFRSSIMNSSAASTNNTSVSYLWSPSVAAISGGTPFEMEAHLGFDTKSTKYLHGVGIFRTYYYGYSEFSAFFGSSISNPTNIGFNLTFSSALDTGRLQITGVPRR